MKRREFAARAAVIFVAPTLLSACGFAMKGPSRLPFATVYLDENAQGPVAEMLRRYLQATPMTRLLGTAAERASAEVQIEIQQDEQDRRERPSRRRLRGHGPRHPERPRCRLGDERPRSAPNRQPGRSNRSQAAHDGGP